MARSIHQRVASPCGLHTSGWLGRFTGNYSASDAGNECKYADRLDKTADSRGADVEAEAGKEERDSEYCTRVPSSVTVWTRQLISSRPRMTNGDKHGQLRQTMKTRQTIKTSPRRVGLYRWCSLKRVRCLGYRFGLEVTASVMNLNTAAAQKMYKSCVLYDGSTISPTQNWWDRDLGEGAHLLRSIQPITSRLRPGVLAASRSRCCIPLSMVRWSTR